MKRMRAAVWRSPGLKDERRMRMKMKMRSSIIEVEVKTQVEERGESKKKLGE